MDKLNTNRSVSVYYDQLRLSDKIVQEGYGEYIVYDVENRLLSREVYNKVYEVFCRYCHNPDVLGSCFQLIHEEVKEIDRHLDVAFVPRTLYDLVVIEAGIREEVEDRRLCDLHDKADYKSFVNRINYYKSPTRYAQKLENCWHLCRFTNENLPDNHDPFVRLLAYRVNQLLVKKFKPKSCFTGKQIIKFAEEEIVYFRGHRENFPALLDSNSFHSYQNNELPAVNFAYDRSTSLLNCSPMGIRNEGDAQIVRNAVVLESCITNAFILYRGGSITEDMQWKILMQQTSLSYGTSLFAGALNDATATVFYYTIAKGRDTYALIIPHEEYKDTPFYIPSTNAICQLAASGEFWHARSKVAKNSMSDSHTSGFFLAPSISPNFISSLNEDELNEELKKYYSTLVPLRG